MLRPNRPPTLNPLHLPEDRPDSGYHLALVCLLAIAGPNSIDFVPDIVLARRIGRSPQGLQAPDVMLSKPPERLIVIEGATRFG